jgi:hypothetical protein
VSEVCRAWQLGLVVLGSSAALIAKALNAVCKQAWRLAVESLHLFQELECTTAAAPRAWCRVGQGWLSVCGVLALAALFVVLGSAALLVVCGWLCIPQMKATRCSVRTQACRLAPPFCVLLSRSGGTRAAGWCAWCKPGMGAACNSTEWLR